MDEKSGSSGNRGGCPTMAVLLLLLCLVGTAGVQTNWAVAESCGRQIKSFLPAGWAVTVTDNVVLVSREQPVEHYNKVSLPLHRDKAELKAMGFVARSTYSIRLEFAAPVTEAELARRKQENEAIIRRYREEHPRPASGKPMGLPREVTERLHKIPDVVTPNWALFRQERLAGAWTAFYDDAVGAECQAVCQRTDELLRGLGLVRWEDAQTGRVLFGVNDIVRFDWDRQVIELRREKALDAMAHLWPHGQQHRPFVVRDDAGVIYEGRCISGESSIGYDGPTIVVGDWTVAPPLFAVEGSYPGGKQAAGGPRFAPRLRAALEKVGVLKAIPADEKSVPIKRLSIPWEGDAKILKVAADVFPETLRLGQKPRVHLRCLPGVNLPALYTLQAETILTQDDGFDYTITHMLSPSLHDVHVLRWNPWGPTPGIHAKTAKAGPARLSVTVIMRQQTDKGIEVVQTVAVPAVEVTILPAEVTDEQRPQR